MITLLKNIECYCPKYIGKKDILITNDKIYKIRPSGEIVNSNLIRKTYDCDGLLCFPGIVDQHVHIIGGGGEQGFKSRVDEIDIKDILNAGVSTVVGLLGADNASKCLKSLYSKAKALESEGITTYIYCGSYTMPTVILTDSVTNDMVFIDKIIGTKVAISDHRSSQPDIKNLIKLTSDIHLGGLLAGKAGVVHIHVGDGKMALELLFEIINRYDFPIEIFVPTHVNRNLPLFLQALKYCALGGNIDMTAGETNGVSVPKALSMLIENNIDLSTVTISSDANGSIPNGGVSKIKFLYDDLIKCVKDNNISPEIVFGLVTKNVAEILKLYPKKGAILEGSDADILITDKNYDIKMLFCMGKLLLNNIDFS